jgi:hypothetical protein
MRPDDFTSLQGNSGEITALMDQPGKYPYCWLAFVGTWPELPTARLDSGIELPGFLTTPSEIVRAFKIPVFVVPDPRTAASIGENLLLAWMFKYTRPPIRQLRPHEKFTAH